MASLELNVVETTLIAVLFLMMGFHMLVVSQATDVGDAGQIRLAKLQAQQELMASNTAR